MFPRGAPHDGDRHLRTTLVRRSPRTQNAKQPTKRGQSDGDTSVASSESKGLGGVPPEVVVGTTVGVSQLASELKCPYGLSQCAMVLRLQRCPGILQMPKAGGILQLRHGLEAADTFEFRPSEVRWLVGWAHE